MKTLFIYNLCVFNFHWHPTITVVISGKRETFSTEECNGHRKTVEVPAWQKADNIFIGTDLVGECARLHKFHKCHNAVMHSVRWRWWRWWRQQLQRSRVIFLMKLKNRILNGNHHSSAWCFAKANNSCSEKNKFRAKQVVHVTRMLPATVTNRHQMMIN